MQRRRFGGVFTGLSLIVAVGAVALPARAQDPSAPVVTPETESPPPAFVAPPPGYEPPTQYAQGAALAAAPATPEPMPTLLTLDRMDPTSRVGIQIGFDKLDQTSISDRFVM